MTDNVKALVDALEAWASPISSGYEVPAAAQAILQAARTLTAQAEEIERLRGELRRIAEGNLGDAPWQANYEKIRDVASAALKAAQEVKA